MPHFIKLFLTDNEVFFLLIKHKEFRILKELLRLELQLIHELNSDGMDCIQYIAHVGTGIAFRITEFLVKMQKGTKSFNSKRSHIQ